MKTVKRRLIKRTPKKDRPGLFWHVHHLILVEYCYNPQERRNYILSEKDPSEHAIRLKWMTPVKHIPKGVRTTDPHEQTYKIKAVSERYWERLHRKEHGPKCPWNGQELKFE